MAAYTKVEIDRRETSLAEVQRTAGELSAANLRFQDEVRSLNQERQDLLSERDSLRSENAGLTAQRDQLLGQREAQTARLAELEKGLAESEASKAELERQVRQARQEGGRQQGRAETAEALGTVLGRALQLDEQIQARYLTLLQQVEFAYTVASQGNLTAARAAYARALQTAQEMDNLLRTREAILRQAR